MTRPAPQLATAESADALARRIRSASALWIVLATETSWKEDHHEPNEETGRGTILVRTQGIEVEPVAWCLTREDAERIAADIRKRPGMYGRGQWHHGAIILVRECPAPLGIKPEAMFEDAERNSVLWAERAAKLRKAMEEA